MNVCVYSYYEYLWCIRVINACCVFISIFGGNKFHLIYLGKPDVNSCLLSRSKNSVQMHIVSEYHLYNITLYDNGIRSMGKENDVANVSIPCM